jgi:hypothetical protein
MWHLSEQMYKNRTKGINIGLCVSDEDWLCALYSLVLIKDRIAPQGRYCL